MRFWKCFCLGVMLALMGVLTACVPVALVPINWMPEEGVWYCEELQLSLSFEEDIESYVIIDGVKKECMTANEQYSKTLSVWPSQDGIAYHSADGPIFSGERVSLTDEEFVLRTEDGEKFVFVRIPQMYGTK